MRRRSRVQVAHRAVCATAKDLPLFATCVENTRWNSRIDDEAGQLSQAPGCSTGTLHITAFGPHPLPPRHIVLAADVGNMKPHSYSDRLDIEDCSLASIGTAPATTEHPRTLAHGQNRACSGIRAQNTSILESQGGKQVCRCAGDYCMVKLPIPP